LLRQFASAAHLVVHYARQPGGPPRVTSLTEVAGMKKARVRLREIYRFRQTGIDLLGRPQGQFEATGLAPAFLNRIQAAGIKLPVKIFEKQVLLAD